MTVKVTKQAINVREKLSELDKETGLKGEELLRADTSSDAREVLELDQHLFEDFESTGIDDNATSTAVTIDSNGNVGIGTSSPDSPLDVVAPLTNSVYASFSSTDTRPLQLSSFDTVSVDAGHDFNASSVNGALSFSTGSSERMRIDSSGNLLVGTTSPINGGRVSALASSTGQAITAKVQSDNYSLFQGFSSNGSLSFQVTGSGVIKHKGTQLPVSDNSADLGTGTIKYRDLYLSGGVYLGGTGSANHLDDYEEGTWTVTLTPSTSGSISLYGSQNQGQYTKVGRLVTVNCFVSINTTSSPVGDVRISLPFANSNLAESGSIIVGTATFTDVSSGYSFTSYPVSVSSTDQFATMYFDPSILGVNDKIGIQISYLI